MPNALPFVSTLGFTAPDVDRPALFACEYAAPSFRPWYWYDRPALYARLLAKFVLFENEYVPPNCRPA
ncbi:hypothetical protein BLA6992_07584 [Burkholderia lata]|nr:hypothetical protein BLA6992_07584 [Burkholderia lata]